MLKIIKHRNNFIRENVYIENSMLDYIKYKQLNWYGHVRRTNKKKEKKKERKKKRNESCVCLRPHARSENFIKARFIIRNATVFVLFYIHKVIIFTIYNYNCA